MERADRLIVGSGISFNRTLEQAAAAAREVDPSIDLESHGVATSGLVAVKFAQLVERCAQAARGLIVVAREDLTINRALRSAASRGVHVG